MPAEKSNRKRINLNFDCNDPLENAIYEVLAGYSKKRISTRYIINLVCSDLQSKMNKDKKAVLLPEPELPNASNLYFSAESAGQTVQDVNVNVVDVEKKQLVEKPAALKDDERIDISESNREYIENFKEDPNLEADFDLSGAESVLSVFGF